VNAKQQQMVRLEEDARSLLLRVVVVADPHLERRMSKPSADEGGGGMGIHRNPEST
jgi:hypothetical protein